MYRVTLFVTSTDSLYLQSCCLLILCFMNSSVSESVIIA